MAENCLSKDALTPSFTADYKHFKKLVKMGELYEYIQQIWWQETGEKISRKEAKKLMFTIAFSSHRYCPEGKKILRKHFPSIIAVIDGYKKSMIQRMTIDGQAPAVARDKGNASFAVLLQRIESEVFIDRILAACYKRNIKALSKHDSILCRQSDKHIVTKIICRVLNNLFGKWTYSLDIDGTVYAPQYKKKTRMKRMVDQVVHTLFGMEYHRANGPPTLLSRTPVTYRERRAAVYAHNARAPKSLGEKLKPLRSQRLEKMRERFWGGN